MSKKKSSYRVIAEALATNQFDKLPISTKQLNTRRITVDEIKRFIVEGTKKAKDKRASDVQPQEQPGGWGDADLEQQIKWNKALKLKEFFNVKGK